MVVHCPSKVDRNESVRSNPVQLEGLVGRAIIVRVRKLHTRGAWAKGREILTLVDGKNTLPLSLSCFRTLNEKKVVTVSTSVGGKKGKGLLTCGLYSCYICSMVVATMMVVVLRKRALLRRTCCSS